MKNLILAVSLVLSINVCAQIEFESNVFVRVYNFDGKKISKGKIQSISETSLTLIRKGEPEIIPINSIASIKTKHSAGNNVLIGATVFAAPLAIIGVATAEPNSFIGYSAGEGALIGTLLGGSIGAIIGSITILFKNSKSYEINGDTFKWKAFTEMIVQ